MWTPAPALPAEGQARPAVRAPKPGRWHRFTAKHPFLRRIFPPWFRRRAWLLVIAILAGTCGGVVYAATASPTYAALATVGIPAGATPNSPGSANDADALAQSYAAIIPGNTALLAPAASKLGVSVDTLASNLSVSVETGSSVLLLKYTAPTRDEAVAGVNAVAEDIVQLKNNHLVAAGTVYTVQLATSARSSSVLAKYGPEIGFVLGALIGLILVLVAERVDPRADKSEDVDEVFGRPVVVSVPSELSIPEFGHAVVNGSGRTGPVTFAPLRWWDVPAAHSIERTLSDAYPEADLGVSTALEEGMAHQLDSRSTLVLIVRSGERMRALGDVLERLHLMGNSPDWIALLDRHELYS